MPDSTIGKFAALLPSIAVFLLGVGCGTLASPEETESSPDFALWIVDQLGATVSSYNPASGELFDLNLPLDENVDPSDTIVADGKIVVTDFTSGKVLSYYQQQQQTLYENSAEQISIRIEEPCAIQHVDDMLWVLGSDSRNIV